MTAIEFAAILGAIANIVLAVIGCATQFVEARITHAPWQWIKYGYAIICFLWAVFYVITLMDALNLGVTVDLNFARIWIFRPLVSLTLALIASSGIARRVTNGH